MSLSEFADLLVPRTCVGCARRGSGWCPRCRGALARPERLAGPSGLARVPVYAMSSHTGSARRAVLAYKERNRRDLAVELAGVYATGLLEVLAGAAERPGAVCLVGAPSGRSAARSRGGQHMQRLAAGCAALLDGVVVPHVRAAGALRLTGGVRDSVGLDATARTANLGAHLRVRHGRVPAADTLTVLLDDVLTTGATAGACVRALRGAGARVAAVLTLTSPHHSSG